MKATKISHIVLTLLSKFKKKVGEFSNFVAFSQYLNFKQKILIKNEARLNIVVGVVGTIIIQLCMYHPVLSYTTYNALVSDVVAFCFIYFVPEFRVDLRSF